MGWWGGVGSLSRTGHPRLRKGVEGRVSSGTPGSPVTSARGIPRLPASGGRGWGTLPRPTASGAAAGQRVPTCPRPASPLSPLLLRGRERQALMTRRVLYIPGVFIFPNRKKTHSLKAEDGKKTNVTRLSGCWKIIKWHYRKGEQKCGSGGPRMAPQPTHQSTLCSVSTGVLHAGRRVTWL